MRKATLIGLLAGLVFGVFAVMVTGARDGIDVLFVALCGIGGLLAGAAWRTTRAARDSSVLTFYGGWIVTGILFVLPVVAADWLTYRGELFSGVGMAVILGGGLGASAAVMERRYRRDGTQSGA